MLQALDLGKLLKLVEVMSASLKAAHLHHHGMPSSLPNSATPSEGSWSSCPLYQGAEMGARSPGKGKNPTLLTGQYMYLWIGAISTCSLALVGG